MKELQNQEISKSISILVNQHLETDLYKLYVSPVTPFTENWPKTTNIGCVSSKQFRMSKIEDIQKVLQFWHCTLYNSIEKIWTGLPTGFQFKW